MVIRIGDRFRDIDPTSEHSEWEVIELGIYHAYKAICVKPGNGWDLDSEECWTFDLKYNWKYIGNFSKSSNFRNLYDILCS